MNLLDESRTNSFSKWRKRLWPVHRCENLKVFSLLLLKFCVSFNFAIIHSTKDTLIVTKGVGAEAIPVLKGGFVLIFAFLFMLIYSKLSNHLSKSKLFYASFMPFVVFFLVYGFFLFPNRDWLTPAASADRLLSFLGNERELWVVIYRNWMDSLFFLMAELWGGVVIGLFFWGLANRMNTIHEASRFYTILSAGGHVGIIVAGPVTWYSAHYYVNQEYLLTVKYLMSFVTFVNLVILAIYWLMDKYVAPKEEVISEKVRSKSSKLSLKESLMHVVCSPYLGCIALMVIGYSISVNMVEVIWKATLKLKFPVSNDYQAFMGIISLATGCLSLFLALFIGGNVIRRFGWGIGAQLTPIILGVVSVIFLGAYMVNYYYADSPELIGASALTVIIICGGIHNVACKSMKYCLFDPTKEMAYISLDEEMKVKGKAAVDVVASRFGKSGSSWIQVGLMEIMGVSSILSIVSYLIPLILISVISWIFAVYFLKRRFEVSVNELVVSKT